MHHFAVGITPARMAKREGMAELARLIEHYVPDPPGSEMFEFDTIFDMAFQMGIDQGTDKGFDTGFDEGFDTGFDKGFEMGFGEIPSIEKKQEMLRDMLRRATMDKMAREKYGTATEREKMSIFKNFFLKYIAGGYP